MDDIREVFRVLWRWSWLIVSIMLVGIGVLSYQLRVTSPLYQTELTLQITTPDREDVSLVDGFRFASERDEITQARNSFIETMKSKEVYAKTAGQLGLFGSQANYKVEITPIQDADLIVVAMEGENAELTATIVNAHVRNTIRRFGQLRAQSASAIKEHLAKQIATAQEELKITETRFVDFKAENGLTPLPEQLEISQELLKQTQFQRNQLWLESSTTNANEIARLDSIIAQQKEEIRKLLELEPEYDLLGAYVTQARKTHELLLGKHAESTLKEQLAMTANFVQIVSAAETPTQPLNQATRLIVLTIVGSLGLGIMLAYIFNYLTTPAPVQRDIPLLPGPVYGQPQSMSIVPSYTAAPVAQPPAPSPSLTQPAAPTQKKPSKGLFKHASTRATVESSNTAQNPEWDQTVTFNGNN